MKKNVTVVIPVYKDWKTLGVCIESLKKYLPSNHTVLLVNDKGPEWTQMEAKIKESIEGYPNFIYACNPENMGFVKTCNRAVTELDNTDNDIFLLNSDTEVTEGFMEELLSVLYLAEKHGVVCPRSNNATLLTVPVNNNLGRNVTAEESMEAYEKVKEKLPRYQVMPTGVGFAFLVKRKLIREYGLFDEIYSPGYNEENDFCLRINQYGFNVIMANRSYVYHHESKSFGDRKKKLDEEHLSILLNRYPFYLNRVSMYFDYQMDAVDYYADLMSDIYSKKRLLISLYEMPSAYNGTAQHGLLLLQNFYNLFKDKYDITVLINQSADEYFGVSKKYENVYYPHTLKGTFHIAYIPSQIIHVEHMHILNRHCLRYAFCMQDIISIRSHYLLVNDWEREIVFKKSIEYCDGIIPFSQFSLDDTKAYYPECFEEREIYTKIVYLANVVENVDDKAKDQKLVFDEYIAVLGNQYKHKYLNVIMPYLKMSKYKYIIIGSKDTGYEADNIYGYRSGNLSDELIDCIFKKSKAILFPSVYEGFGLPILNAIKYGKKIIVNNNPLNQEQKQFLENYKKYMYMFDYANNLEECIDQMMRTPDIVEAENELCNRTWADVAIEVEQGLSEILSKPIDYSLLRKRWTDMKYEERVHRCYVPMTVRSKKPLKQKVKDRIKFHHPKLYRILKDIKDKMN